MHPKLTTRLCLTACLLLCSACATTTPNTSRPPSPIPTEFKQCEATTPPPQMTTQRELALWLTPEVVNGWMCTLGAERLDRLR